MSGITDLGRKALRDDTHMDVYERFLLEVAARFNFDSSQELIELGDKILGWYNGDCDAAIVAFKTVAPLK